MLEAIQIQYFMQHYAQVRKGINTGYSLWRDHGAPFVFIMDCSYLKSSKISTVATENLTYECCQSSKDF